MCGTAGSFLSAKRGDSSGCDRSFAFPTVDGEWFSLSSFFFFFVPHSPPPSVTVHMIQVHQISRLWEECQKHSKQYIKHRQKRQWHSTKSQNMNLQWHTKHPPTPPPTPQKTTTTKNRLKSKVTIAWLKMKTLFFFFFFKDYNRPLFSTCFLLFLLLYISIICCCCCCCYWQLQKRI